ncbi:hypothetical protein B0H67DRAFT_474534 [Lasiosphaeris hirsuta]|uniref:Autophagy-related protein 1 n=1 Tax=Lasiosphaeris hirsuta TaxID=260670 RepID=A0AA40BAD7_9PEZI|nr:hypothetical protein B0H67DRAFT_474534 [Lasiosphaeris hirsuta]
MDYYEDSQPTQATQTVVDPRRLGEQNSGLSDEDISDIICILVPYSESARQELKRIADENSRHMLARDEADQVDINYELEDNVQNFGLVQQSVGDHHIALRFSVEVKNPLQGFTFGRNPSRCDISIDNDPKRRLSNVHFRIYLNEYAVLMLEDQSTNGTIVDEQLLKKKANPTGPTKRTLSSGSKIRILMFRDTDDLVFLVRIPLRDGRYQAAYQRNLAAYMGSLEQLRRQQLVNEQRPVDVNKTIIPGPGGHVDIFKPSANKPRAVVWDTARKAPLAEETQQIVPFDRLPKSWSGSDRYNRVGEIGKGAFAVVYKVTSKFSGLPFAAKELDKRKFMKNGVLDQKVENEMKIMQQVKHPHIVNYVEHLDWDDRLLIIIMEYIAGGDLGKLIAEFGPLTEMEVRSIARQLLDAIGYLHDKNITHRDVKPDNILVSSRNPLIVKLTDFGLSKMIDNEETFLRTFCGTLLYCAPEVYSEFTEYDDYGRRHPRNRHYRAAPGQRYDHAVDIWSLGGVLFYALTKKPPFPAKNGASHSELLHQIMTRPLDMTPLVNAGVSHVGIDFLSRMLDRRPESRADVEYLQQHPWVSELTSQSCDEVSDEELRIDASQLSLIDKDSEETVELEELIPDSDDEILDDEEVNDENHFSGYESEKENYTFGPGNGDPGAHRLFGEVNASALGSSGVIPAERLNLPVSASSFATTEILGGGVTEIRDSFDSSNDSLTPREHSQLSQPNSGNLRTSVLLANRRKPADELNSTFDEASQSLGGAESILEHLNMKSRAVSLRSGNNDLNMSKRKPSFGSSDETEAPTIQDRRVLKRLRSEGSVDSASRGSVDDPEYDLFAHIPSIARAQSGRQIDTPVHKSTFWSAQDRKTWHLKYPEMTQLQLDAFKIAATARSEDFGPGKTPLWELAMKYFPPTLPEEAVPNLGKASRSANKTLDAVPPTGADSTQHIPDTQDPNAHLIAQPDPMDKRIAALLQSTPASAVPDISVFVTESMASWGRAPENTRSYSPKTEAKVPKYAFKIILWKEDFDPCKYVRPWNRPPVTDESLFHFYIATKATNGIYINGKHLPSVNCKNPASPCTFWIRLHNGDSVVIWQTGDGAYKTELTFTCDWGGSAEARPRGSHPTYAPELVAKRLDELCVRTERKMRSLSEHDVRMEEANHDVDERTLRIAQERDRSRAFEFKRLEACRALQARRGSPGPYGGDSSPNTQNAYVRAAHFPGSRTVPTFRPMSPSATDVLRGARR